MEIKFNNVFSISLIILLILIYIFPKTLILSYIDFFMMDSKYELSALDILFTSLTSIIICLPNLVIGLWQFVMAKNLQQDKWTWLLIGLVFGQYSLIFLALLLIVNSIKLKVDLYKSLRPVLILLIISFFLNLASGFLIRPYMDRLLNKSGAPGFVMQWNSYLSFFIYGIMILLNIMLAIRLNKLIGKLQIKGKYLWTISTVILGLFPVILFNELIITKMDNNNAA